VNLKALKLEHYAPLYHREALWNDEKQLPELNKLENQIQNTVQAIIQVLGLKTNNCPT
jgi:hypothetical protein